MAAGGCDTWLAVAAEAPSTLFLVGAATVLTAIGAAAICCAFIVTDAFATGCALVNARCGTAVTAPGTVLLTYVMFVTCTFVVLIFVICVLYTFVTVVLLTTVLLTFTRFTYAGLTWYAGT